VRRTDHIHACLLAVVTLALATGTSLAFFPTNLRTTIVPLGGHSHERITTDALEALDSELFGVQSPSGSMRAANESIVDGNTHVDDDQSHSALHFDGENFVAGQGRILGLKEAVIASIQGNDAQGAREELGQALHSIQDFYAHSNWTNNNGGTNPDLGVDGHQLQNTLGTNDPAEVNGVLTTGLTSGYYHGEDRVPATRIGTAGRSTACRSWTSDSVSTVTATIRLSRRSSSSTRRRRAWPRKRRRSTSARLRTRSPRSSSVCYWERDRRSVSSSTPPTAWGRSSRRSGPPRPSW
jgi:hypothetical protein